jgi:hypothetical protein
MNKIEQLEQQLAAMQQELEELKKGKLVASVEEKPKAMLPKEGQWYLSPFNFDVLYDQDLDSDNDINIFPDKETAEAYADALRVMLELRRQPGSAIRSEGRQEDAWIITRYGSTEEYSYTCDCFALCPPFSSKELARQAGEAVGVERIKRAYATLSGIKGE